MANHPRHPVDHQTGRGEVGLGMVASIETKFRSAKTRHFLNFVRRLLPSRYSEKVFFNLELSPGYANSSGEIYSRFCWSWISAVGRKESYEQEERKRKREGAASVTAYREVMVTVGLYRADTGRH